jgi:uncharacterized protein with PIN domain
LDAFARYGDGGGRSVGFNLPDCFPGAVAKHHGPRCCSKGGDFSKTVSRTGLLLRTTEP